MEIAVGSTRSDAGGALLRRSGLLRLCDASVAGNVFARDDARGATTVPFVPLRDDVEKCAGWSFANRRNSA